ncbi:MAG: hypothetical protein JWM44_2358 [Bacilli bacterium]|nr:hypothetical protein [Bacilli bacterium]
MTSIQQSFLQFLCDRMNETGGELITINSYYRIISDQCSHYFRQLQANLPEHLQIVMLKYEETLITLQIITEKNMYIQGFNDGKALNEILVNLNTLFLQSVEL